MSVLIRPARAADVSAVNAIYNEAILNTTATFDLEPRPDEEAREWLLAHSPAYPLFIAEIGGQVAGWASLSPYAAKPAYCYTVENSVYIDPRYQGRGLGKALLAEAIKAAAVLGYRAIIAKITADNEISLALHRQAGFAQVGEVKAVGWKFGRWLDVIFMELLFPESVVRFRV